MKSRREVVALLWCYAFLSYLLRLNITVAQQSIAREFSFNDIQVGYLFTAFLVGYSIFQIPGGWIGDKWGPRIVLGICGLWWAATTALSGLLPGLLLLVLIRFLHGVGEAPTYPVIMTAVADWFPSRQHAFVNSIIITGSTLGSAIAPPLVAQVMNRYGWRVTFYLTAVFPLIVAFLWSRKTRGIPNVTGPQMIKTSASWWRILLTRSMFFLCLSYFLYCYTISIFVYWLFKYLVDVRHLSIINSGWVNSLPWITASVLVPVTGFLSVKYSDKVGFLIGRRRIAAGCLLGAAVLLYFGVQAAAIYPAVAAIAVSVGLLFSTESAYFSSAIQIGGRDAGSASGLMNLSGNFGSVAATSAVPLLVLHYGWITALLSGSGIAVLAAVTWYGVAEKNT